MASSHTRFPYPDRRTAPIRRFRGREQRGMDLASSDSDSDSSNSISSVDEELYPGQAVAVPATPEITTNPTEIFKQSMVTFRESLPPGTQNQLVQCNNAESLILNIETIAYNFRHKSKVSRLIACCNVIKNFAQAWEPFFEITTILVSSHPEYAACAWGAIRLVFLLGSNFITFLEKLCNMFERMRLSLSLYHRAIFNIIAAPHVEHGKELGVALSLIYADIMEFCQQATAVFAKKGSFSLQSLRTISSIVFVPFDTRFGALIERFAFSQRVFEGELALLDQKILVKHFQRFELKTQSDIRAQEKARRKESRLSERKKKEKDRKKRRRQAEREERKKELIKKRVRDIQLWIDIPKFMNIFEESRRTHHPGTGNWLLQETYYTSWKNNEQVTGDGTTPLTSRLLSLEANPGFGKTILSAVAIDDLRATAKSGTYIAFFHFDGEDEGKRSRSKAWRAVVAQLLYESKNDPGVVDAATILMDEGGTGQLFASDDEIEELLGILLHRLSVFLVLDGVDECHDWEQLLLDLWELCASSDTKVLLLSRPTLMFPPPYSGKKRDPSWRVRLTSSQNNADIKMLLETHLESMSQIGLLPASCADLNLVDEIALRSSGMFLWVRLLLNYVACHVLSPAERLQALQETVMLNGLERMYTCILQVIESRYTREKQFVFQVLNWMLVVYRRMSLGEMHTATAIRPGCPTAEDSHIVDLEHTLSSSSLGLIEVTAGKVQFIHTSVREYLTSIVSSSTTFKALKNEAHLMLSTVCLSYLTYDMPTTPLSWHSETAVSVLPHIGSALQQFQRGTSRIHRSDPLGPSEEATKAEFRRILEADFAANAPVLQQPISLRSRRRAESPSVEQTKKAHSAEREQQMSSRGAEIESHFPLLGYAAQYWHEHAKDSLAGCKLPLTSTDFATCSDFLALLSTFMLDRKLVTSWVEACSLFGSIPSVQHLVGPLSRLGYHHLTPGPAQREFLWTCAGLKQLSAALQHLEATHRELLMAKPAAIWSNAIKASTDADFWPLWEPSGKREDGGSNDSLGVRLEEKNLWDFGAAR